MRHSNSGRKFSRTPSHRKVLLVNLTKALLRNGKIRTTVLKAKDMRSVVEPMITLAKRDDLHARRLAYKVLNDHKLVKYLFDVVGPQFAGVPGGYTRISKLAMPRRGDCAPMAIIELTRNLRKEEAASDKSEEKPAATEETKSE